MKLMELGMLPLAIISAISFFVDLFDLLEPTIRGDWELGQTAKTGIPIPRAKAYNSNCIVYYSWNFISLRPISIHQDSIGELHPYFSGIPTFYRRHNNLLSRTSPR